MGLRKVSIVLHGHTLEEAISVFSGNAGLIPAGRLGRAGSLRDRESYCRGVVEATSFGVGEVAFTGKKDS